MGIAIARMTKYLLWTMLLFLLPLDEASAQQTGIEQRVADAIQSARKGNLKPVALLKKDAELVKALPYLKNFLTDPNPAVTSAVFALAEGIHTPDAVGILTDLMTVNNGRWGEASVKSFYDDYDCKELFAGGGSRLRDNLISFVEKERGFSNGKAILLLSCFKGDKEVTRALEAVRKKSHRKVNLDWSNRIDIATCIDITLAEIGHQDASGRLLRRIAIGEVNELVFMFRAIRFINEQGVLAALLERIKDKRPAIYPWSDAFYLRIGDLAVNALAQKAQKSLDIPVKTNYRYSDEELEKAYSLLRIHSKG